MRLAAWASSLVLILRLGGPATAADLPIAAFFGTFQGGGVAESEDSLYFAVTARDLDVKIAKSDGGGFALTWTSVIHSGGDPANPDVKRRTATWRFVPDAKHPGRVFRCADQGDPFAGEAMCWARIHERTLSVYALAVRDDGGYELQQYDRTLKGTGMDLLFTRHRDGERVRKATGSLVKTAN